MATMTCKWGDAMTEAMVHSVEWGSTAFDDKERPLFRAQIAHVASLLHALALAHLRGQTDMGKDGGLYLKAAIEPGQGRSDEFVTTNVPGCTCEELLNSWCRLMSGQKGYEQFLSRHMLPVLGGVSASELALLQPLTSLERVQVTYAQLIATFSARRAMGGLRGGGACEPPSFARLGNYFSDGHVNFAQACKIGDRPLPFPYQQSARSVLNH